MAVQDEELSEFLKNFTDPLHHRQPESSSSLWVFWSKDEEEDGSQNISSSADVATNGMIYDKIKSAFSIEVNYGEQFILQFWAPVTIGGRRLLSTSGQPFSVSHLDDNLADYRLRSLTYSYNIDETNKLNIEQHPAMIVSGEASSAFLNRFPMIVYFKDRRSLDDYYALQSGLKTSYLLPIFCPSQSSSCCVGVVEGSMNLAHHEDLFILSKIKSALEKVGLSVFLGEIIDGLKSRKEEIEEALEIVCESHCISLAQVWISYKDEYHAPMPFSFYLEDPQENRMFLKFNDYIVDENSIAFQDTFKDYYDYSWIRLHLHTGEELFKKTFQDYEPRFCKNISVKDMANVAPDDKTEGSALVICLRSISTGYLDYAFEFLWRPKSKYLFLLEQLLLTLKRYLPSFKFASGAELGDELNVIDVDNSTSETRFFKIFQGKKISPIPETLEKGKKLIVEDYLPHSKSKCKTTPILLSRQAIEQQFGNTMKEAAKNLSELGDELNVIDVDNSTSETRFFKIFQGKKISPIPETLEKGKKLIVEDYLPHSKSKCKTTPILLSRQAIEQQFGNTMKEAAKNLSELGDELNVIDVDNSTSETRFFKIFQGKKISPIPETLEKGKKLIVEDYLPHSKSKCKTTPILLSRQAIEQQFGNTMKEAAKNLSVSLSTLKRKCHGYGISEWQGPSLAKRKVNDSSNNQRDKNEEDNGAIQDPSAVNKNENTLIIKAEWEDDMIKFHLSISQATFVTVEKEIGMQFNLTMGTYKLKYLDEDGDWILLKSDQDMSNCIKSSRKLDRTQVRLRVQQCTQPIPGPTGSYELCRS